MMGENDNSIKCACGGTIQMIQPLKSVGCGSKYFVCAECGVWLTPEQACAMRKGADAMTDAKQIAAKTVEERAQAILDVVSDYGDSCRDDDNFTTFGTVQSIIRRHLTEAVDDARHKEREWAITCVRRYHADMVQKLARGEKES